MGFGEPPALDDILGSIIARVVGQKQKDVQFHTGQLVFLQTGSNDWS